MGFQIEDGQGSGYRAGVTDEHQIKVVSESHELQHHVSWLYGQTYQVEGSHTLASSGTKNTLHIKNTSPTRDMVITFVRLQFVGDGTIDVNTYMQYGFGPTYASGGAVITSVNMNRTSANAAEATCYDDNLVTAGTFIPVDTWYCDASQIRYEKQGSIILGLNDTFMSRLITDQTAGIAYTRVTFNMIGSESNK